MPRLAAAFSTALLLAAGPAAAEIERVTIDTKEGKVERWWPKVAIPKGWHHDRGNSLNYNLNALAPSGESFGSAEAVLYARAIRQSSDANLRNLEEFMARERSSFLKRTPNYTITDGKPLVLRDGLKLPTRLFDPKGGNGNWERVAYGEEDDHYIVFVASARSKKALDAIAQPFEQMVRQYRRRAK
jgi:hypothetical protein